MRPGRPEPIVAEVPVSHLIADHRRSPHWSKDSDKTDDKDAVLIARLTLPG